MLYEKVGDELVQTELRVGDEVIFTLYQDQSVILLSVERNKKSFVEENGDGYIAIRGVNVELAVPGIISMISMLSGKNLIRDEEKSSRSKRFYRVLRGLEYTKDPADEETTKITLPELPQARTGRV